MVKEWPMGGQFWTAVVIYFWVKIMKEVHDQVLCSVETQNTIKFSRKKIRGISSFASMLKNDCSGFLEA